MNKARKVKISLVALSSPCYPVMVSPVAVMTLSGYLRSNFKDAADVTIYYSQIEQIVQIAAAIDQERPDIIGLSLQVDTEKQMEVLMVELKARISTWKKQPLVVFGNVLATFAAKRLLNKYPDVLMVVGEGEYALAEIVKKVLSGRVDFATITNIVFKSEGQLIETQRRAFNLEEFCLPAFDYVKEIAESEGHIWIEASRGCNGHCTFCSRYPVRMTGWTPVTAEKILTTITQLHTKFGIKHFRFTDDDFMGTNSEDGIVHAEKIAQGIIDRGLKITFDISTRVDAMYTTKKSVEKNKANEKIFKLLRDAGLTQVFLGVESGSCSQLRRFAKGVSVVENSMAISKFLKLGIQLVIGFITIDYLMELKELEENIAFLRQVGTFNRDKEVFVSDCLVTLRALEGSAYIKMLAQDNRLLGVNGSYLSYHAVYKDARIEQIVEKLNWWREQFFSVIYVLKNRVSKLSMEKNVSLERDILEEFLYSFKLRDYQFLLGITRLVKESKSLGSFCERFVSERLVLMRELSDKITGSLEKRNRVLVGEIEKVLIERNEKMALTESK